MSKRTIHTSWLAIFMTVAVIFSAVTAHADIKAKIYTKRGAIVGTARYLTASKVYKIKDSRTGVETTISAKDVIKVEVGKPAGFDALIKKASGSSSSSAIPALEKIMKDYKMFQYDVLAAAPLANAYMKNNRAKDAQGMCDMVLANDKSAILDDSFSRVYAEILLELKLFSKLKSIIKIMIERGDRGTAALAQIMRGDIEMKQGNYREAVVNGYLRTAVLFGNVKSVQPEALYKAAKCFTELGELSHAEKMRKKLLADYPDNSYTRQLNSES